jgi:hypothetical protein
MNIKIYRSWLMYCIWSAALVLSACRNEESARPAKVISVDKLQTLAESMDKPGFPAAEAQKIAPQFDALSFEEMEAFIDLRYDLNEKLRLAPTERAVYLRDFRHRANRKAHELHQKPFQQLQSEQADAVLAIVEGKTGTGSSHAARNGRTASECNSSTPLCTAWQSTSSVPVNNSATPDKWLTAATYIGERTVQCSPTVYQDDCDYLFRFIFAKIWRAGYIKTNYGTAVITGSFASKLIDNNPSWIDCGTYTLQALYGKGRIDFVYGFPESAASNLQLGLINSIQTGSCYLGTWGSETWYLYGIYQPQWDNWGRNVASPGAYQQCRCDVYGYKVL